MSKKLQPQHDKGKRKHTIQDYIRSSTCKCSLLVFGAFVIILALFFCVCTPRKYDLKVGSISHVTINATKDVVDEVTTEEKRNAAALEGMDAPRGSRKSSSMGNNLPLSH